MDPEERKSPRTFWSIVKALRTRMRRIIRSSTGRRKLQMPLLETQRLVLRKFEPSDLGEVVEWEPGAAPGDAALEAQKFLDYCFREYRELGIGPWAIKLKGADAIVGNCAFLRPGFENSFGEVNYYVAPRYRGRGLALEALEALLGFGFRDAGLTRIQARCDADNLSSERVMRKAGMKFEGWVSRIPGSQGPLAPQKLYVILADDFHRAASGRAETRPSAGWQLPNEGKTTLDNFLTLT